jgi:hypothetical protein
MQSTKDTFYIALRDRISAQFPARTVNLGGMERPAILVPENEVRTALAAPAPFDFVGAAAPSASKTRLTDCFYLQFGAVSLARPTALPAHDSPPLLAMKCSIVYATSGTPDSTGADRGRSLAALDTTLLAICSPGLAPKTDFSQQPPRLLGANIVWSAPELGPPLQLGLELRRTAQLTIFFYPET